MCCGARAGLLANSGCFVSTNTKCFVVWCFVVFCGCFVMFCGCFAVFCECFAVFPQNTQNTRKTSKNTGKHKKLTIRSCIAYCGSFPRAKQFDCIAQNTFHKTSAKQKHRKTSQNSHKTRFVKLRRKTLQNARKPLENVTKRSQYYSIQPQYTLRAFGILSQNTLDLRFVAKAHNTQYTRKLRGGVRAGGHLAGL